jgi:predicted CoA-binding protein
MAETAASERAKARPSIERLRNPKSVAIAGISSTPGSLAGIVLDNLRSFGFSRELHLVHPKQDEIQGLRCVRNVREATMMRRLYLDGVWRTFVEKAAEKKLAA